VNLKFSVFLLGNASYKLGDVTHSARLLALVIAIVFLPGPSIAQTQTPRTQNPQAQTPQPQKDSATQKTDEFQNVFDNANVLLRQGRIEDALNEFRRAAKLRDDKCAECFQRIGQVLLQTGQLKESAAALRKAAELKPANEAEMYNILGVVLYLQNEKASYDEAVVALQKAIELSNGKVVKSYYNLGFALIKSGKEQEGIEVLKKYVELDPTASEVAQAKAVIGNVKLVDAKVAPSFNVKSHTGDEISLEKARGKIVLLDFWASWCVPCRMDMPEIKRIWKKYGGDNRFSLIGIDLDSSKPPFEAYMKEEGISWQQYYDGLGWGNKIARLYGVYSIPQTILIDHEGVIRATNLRGDQLAEKIDELLAKMPGK
jgi:tetratricopeptide (TPR) repeat protein